jgi:Arc/MetJ-type ribon-helix-helix transcriptional regulator
MTATAATAAAAKKATATTTMRTDRQRAAAADSTTKTAATTKSTAAAKSGRPRAKTAPAKAGPIGTTEPPPAQARKAPPAPASATQINFRADEETRQALEILTRDGTSVSEAIRTAIRLAVWRMKEDQMVRDAEAAMADPADVAEMLQLRADLDSISAR